MRLRKCIPIFLAIAMAISIMSCALVTGPDKDVIIKITARRIAFHGFELKPDMFTCLGEVAKTSCETIADQGTALEVAFTAIVERVTKEMDDPLLAQDIQDIVELLGIKFDAAFNLVGLSPEKLKYISIFVCSFSQGVEAAKKARK